MKQLIEFLKNRIGSAAFIVNDKGILLLKQKLFLTFSKSPITSNVEVVPLPLKNSQWLPIVSKIIGYPYDDIFKELDVNYEASDFNVFSKEELTQDWNKLKNSNYTMSGFSIIRHFHKSLLYCNRKGRKSPIESINNAEDRKRAIENRMMYSDKKKLTKDVILDGLTVSQRAPRVSVFSPYLAKSLIKSIYPNCETIIDPFSGFSGRMLGALSLGKQYVGSDLREDVVKESNDILNFLELKASLSSSDFKKCSIKTGDLLLTCPPYSDKELWPGVSDYKTEDFYIDYILQNFKCKKYVFIVKETKHEDKVVRQIKNGSWRKSNENEKVLVFE